MRECNENGVFSSVLRTGFSGQQLESGLFIVVDGRGGHEGGQKAAATSIQVISHYLLASLTKSEFMLVDPVFILESMETALLAAHHALVGARKFSGEVDRNAPAVFDGDTTATIAILVKGKVFIGHVGDTRAYRLTSAQFQQITREHRGFPTLVRGHLYGFLGQESGTCIDFHILPIAEGDYLLLCSDGLTRYVEEVAIQQVIAKAPDPQVTCDRLVALANERGGEDNVSVIVVQF